MGVPSLYKQTRTVCSLHLVRTRPGSGCSCGRWCSLGQPSPPSSASGSLAGTSERAARHHRRRTADAGGASVPCVPRSLVADEGVGASWGGDGRFPSRDSAPRGPESPRETVRKRLPRACGEARGWIPGNDRASSHRAGEGSPERPRLSGPDEDSACPCQARLTSR